MAQNSWKYSLLKIFNLENEFVYFELILLQLIWLFKWHQNPGVKFSEFFF